MEQDKKPEPQEPKPLYTPAELYRGWESGGKAKLKEMLGKIKAESEKKE